jgi:hypothetical protein
VPTPPAVPRGSKTTSQQDRDPTKVLAFCSGRRIVKDDVIAPADDLKSNIQETWGAGGKKNQTRFLGNSISNKIFGYDLKSNIQVSVNVRNPIRVRGKNTRFFVLVMIFFKTRSHTATG